MKLCITAAGNTLDSKTDASFGRAPWLLLVDTESFSFEAIENKGVNASQGAGIAAAQMINDHGAQGVLTGRVGPKAAAALESCNIQVFEGIDTCSVREAVDQFQRGRYGTGQSGESTAPADSAAAGCRTRCGGGGQGKGGRGMGQGKGRRGGM